MSVEQQQQQTTPRRGSFLAASVEKMRVDNENVPLTALAGRSGRTPNKRMTMGGPTMVPYAPRSPSSPLVRGGVSHQTNRPHVVVHTASLVSSEARARAHDGPLISSG